MQTKDQFRAWMLTAEEEDLDDMARRLFRPRKAQRYYQRLLGMNVPALMMAAQALVALDNFEPWQLACILYVAVRNSGPYLRSVQVHFFMDLMGRLEEAATHAD